MTLRRIELDHCPKPRRGGRVLLGIGLLAAALCAVVHAGLLREASSWEAAALPAARSASRSAEQAAPDPLELGQAGEVIRKLSLPWDSLFRGMEAATVDRVALLGVLPDPSRRVVVLSGEAAGYGDVLRYMSRLDNGDVLTRPRLLSHEIRSEGAAHPVAFSITTEWRTAP